MKKRLILLWVLFAVLLANRLTIRLSSWGVLSFISMILSWILLKKCGRPSKRHTIISIVLALIAAFAYIGYERVFVMIEYGLFAAAMPTLLASMAVFSVMETKGGFRMLAGKDRESVLVSIILGVITGIALSFVNMTLSSEPVSFDFTFWKLFLSLNPAILEEMAFRAVFMAYCIYFAEDEKLNGFEMFTMYFMMCVPHSLAHGYGLVDTVILSLVFGLPFAFLQHRRDITTAMISHGIVDFIRFILTGY